MKKLINIKTCLDVRSYAHDIAEVRMTLLFVAALLVTACDRSEIEELQEKKENHAENLKGGRASTSNARTMVTGVDRLWIATTNMQTDRIEMYDPTASDWNDPLALLYTWEPSTSLGYTASEVGAWGNPLDIKQRRVYGWSGTYLATVGGTLASIVTYPSGTKKWARDVGGYPHSVEILPNGNIAIASLTDWVRVYASSQSASNGTYAQFSLTDARGVLYDPINKILWALGKDVLTALNVGGTAAAPSLTEITSRRSTLPTTSGIDIMPFYGDLNKLLISTHQGVYIYDKTSMVFSQAPGNAFQDHVNGISNQPYGQIVEARWNAQCTYNSWCTPTVDFYTSDGIYEYSRTVTGAAFSKAKTISPYYQTRAEYGIATYNVRVITTLDDPDNSWSSRRPLIADMIRKYNMDIFGVQEPKGVQITDMANDLPEYSRFGVSDHNDYAYQHQDIFYKTAMFELLDNGKFWMAPGGPTTPPATKPWDNQYDACVCTWGRFKDRSTDFEFYVFNAHFDPGGAIAKEESANLMLSKISGIAGSSPVIFMGDLNANQNTTPYAILNNASLLDESWEIADTKYPVSRQTGNWWDPNWDYNSQIDHIFVTTHWHVKSRGVLRDTYNGKLPSDHYPVLVELPKL